MKLSVLSVPFSFGENKDTLYPCILQDTQHTVLVDCGYPGFMPLIAAAAGREGILLEQLTGIFITHHDIDHVGGLSEIKDACRQAKVYASAIEEPYISGKEKAPRLIQAENMYDTLPEDQKAGARQFQQMLGSIQPVVVDHTFTEDGLLPFGQGGSIIHTPGHTPGHLSVYLEAEQVLIAGDALVFIDGEFDIANPDFTLDLAEAVNSVRKLQQLPIRQVVCYHGGIVTDDIPARLDRLLSKYAYV